jgi:hypothetical protein
MIDTGFEKILQGTGRYFCQIQNQLHVIGYREDTQKECIHRKCIRCGQPDPRINNQAREFCTDCMAAIPQETDNTPLVIDWGKIIEKR